ncbi:metalloregulator ArsR/SmtB family transcription factor [Saccharothrix sp. S26]|uniref:ArsR/SmtB family transcription factor n=1 Tax=Saccharothrix sp. S26 TaxID=2907215 RepID=UPI001F1A362F|nr:metalloregulator ArsR/SmtB family transcription factor [Saccharothrix sp. S26]MCE6994590.1 metalloregulator ArsR/SmtB family transcription factor [Saccharothrix sp. S26]
MPNLDEPERAAIELGAVLHALSDPTRLAVVRQIDADGERLCGALMVDVAKSTLSQHLRVLREAGITRTRARGNQRWVSLRRDDLDELFPGLLDVVLVAAERHCRKTGDPAASGTR